METQLLQVNLVTFKIREYLFPINYLLAFSINYSLTQLINHKHYHNHVLALFPIPHPVSQQVNGEASFI